MILEFGKNGRVNSADITMITEFDAGKCAYIHTIEDGILEITDDKYTEVKGKVEEAPNFHKIENFGYINADNVSNYIFISDLVSYAICFKGTKELFLDKKVVSGLDNSLDTFLKGYTPATGGDAGDISGQINPVKADVENLKQKDTQLEAKDTELANKDTQLEGKITAAEKKIKALEDKLGALTGTGFSGATVTDLLKDVKAQLDKKSDKA